jgi:hypothetical protein
MAYNAYMIVAYNAHMIVSHHLVGMRVRVLVCGQERKRVRGRAHGTHDVTRTRTETVPV